MKDSHQLDVQTVLKNLQSSLSGLSQEEAHARLDKWGCNEIKGKKQKSRLLIFLGQFRDLMILLLAVAAVVSFVSGERVDAFVILTIILGNAIIGYVQEYGAEQAIRKLQQMATSNAVVLRSGAHAIIEAAALVPGDIILLEAGKVVPADARLLIVNGLKAEEAALTGESLAADKITEPLTADAANPGDQTNMVFKGTYIGNGSGTAVVTATGMQTEMGKIASMLEGPQQKTPLQKRLSTFGRHLTIIVLVICGIIFGLGLFKGEPVLSMFLTAMSLAVAALPEALPVVVTIALARGAARMAKKNALVRQLTAVETLGSVGYICSDKTGTLTQNKMTVEYTQAEGSQEDLLLKAMLLNHEVAMTEAGDLLGDPTETALVMYAQEKGPDRKHLSKSLPVARVIPFDSTRMLMTTVHQHGQKWIVFVKGAPARILEKLGSRHEGLKQYWLEQNQAWAAKGHRIIFFAWKEIDALPAVTEGEMLESDLDFLGMVSMIDPPRAAAIDAIQQCHEAGISLVMITGDQALTAKSIAERLHIIRHESEKVITGAELLAMSDAQLQEEVTGIRVYARVSPEQKLKIVRALQATGESVAMTGDGVNDAPSLKQADIGVAMGVTGTDVAKEAAHMILLDDNIATIVTAIQEGRRIYENIRKFVRYILACNLGELLTILLAPLLGLPIPLLPIHILWINLVTDGLPGIALVAEPAEDGIMKRPPRPAGEHLFADGMILNIISTGIIIAAGALLTQYLAVKNGYDATAQHTMVFTMLCLVQLGNALSVRAGKQSIFHRIGSNPALLGAVGLTVLLQIALMYTPFLSRIFKITSLDMHAVEIVCLITLGCMAATELLKLTTGKIGGNSSLPA